jgi:hypothetical protein
VTALRCPRAHASADDRKRRRRDAKHAARLSSFVLSLT